MARYREYVQAQKKKGPRASTKPAQETEGAKALRREYFRKSPAGRRATDEALQMRLWG